MKTRFERTIVVFGAAAVIGLVYPFLAWSQDVKPLRAFQVNEGSVPVGTDENVIVGTPPGDELFPSNTRGRSQNTLNISGTVRASFQQRYQQAVAAIRDAEDPESKAAATTHLEEVLSAYFEQDIDARQQELEKIATRLKKLRDQLDIRQDKKREIINLQLRIAVNEVDGLGFFRSSGGRGDRYGGGDYGAGGYGGGYGGASNISAPPQSQKPLPVSIPPVLNPESTPLR